MSNTGIRVERSVLVKDKPLPKTPLVPSPATSNLSVNVTSSSQSKWPDSEAQPRAPPSFTQLHSPTASNVRDSSIPNTTTPMDQDQEGCSSTNKLQAHHMSRASEDPRYSSDVKNWADSLFSSRPTSLVADLSLPAQTKMPFEQERKTAATQTHGSGRLSTAWEASSTDLEPHPGDRIDLSGSLPSRITLQTPTPRSPIASCEGTSKGQTKKKRNIFNLKSAVGYEKKASPGKYPSDTLLYFNHDKQAVESRSGEARRNRESFYDALNDIINSEPPTEENGTNEFSPASVWEPDSDDDESEEQGRGIRRFFKSKVSSANLLSRPSAAQQDRQPPKSSGSDGSKTIRSGSSSGKRTVSSGSSIPSAFGSFGGAIGGGSAIGFGMAQDVDERSIMGSGPSLFDLFRSKKAKAKAEGCSDVGTENGGVSHLMEVGLPESPKRLSILASDSSSIRALLDVGEDNDWSTVSDRTSHDRSESDVLLISDQDLADLAELPKTRLAKLASANNLTIDPKVASRKNDDDEYDEPLPTSPLLGSDRPPFLSGLGIDLPTPTQPRFLSRAHKKSQVAHNVFPETYPDHERSRESTPTSSSSGDATSRNSIEQLSSVTQIEPSQPEYLDTQASAAKSSQEVSVIKPTTSEEPSHGSEPKSNDATFADDSSSVYSDHTAEPVDEHEDEPDLADDPDDHKPGLEDFDPAIIPAPLQINKLRNRGQLQVSRTEEGKINRKGSFMEKLNAEKRHREELIRSKSHPALRTAALEQESEERWMISERQRSQTPTIPKLVRIDSGIGMPPTKLPPLPGSVTAPLPQTNFLSTTPVKSSVSPSIERAFEALLRGLNRTPTKHEADCARLQKNAFMQMFRTDLGLAQLRPAGRNEPKHSNHPFQFDAENIMCNDKHNPPPPTSPAAVRAPLGTPTTVSMPAMPTTANVPSQILAAAKKCARCKRHCCLFTTLLQISQGRGGRELREQAVRNQALQRVNKLKQSFPNGIEPYDTFVTCGTCSLEVCPVCAKICDEQLCGHVICKACVCSAHEEC